MARRFRQLARRAAHQILLQVGVVATDRQRKLLEVEIGPARQRIDQKLTGSVHGIGILPLGSDSVYRKLYDWQD